jgi:hypothetical protein
MPIISAGKTGGRLLNQSVVFFCRSSTMGHPLQYGLLFSAFNSNAEQVLSVREQAGNVAEAIEG